MKKFIIKTLLSITLFIFTLSIYYTTYDYYLNKKDYSEKSIYIWGDSQVYQGLNLNIISTNTDLKTYSGAIHGAGVYDFLVFANKVPENSKIILSISKPAQIRDVDIDYNLSGLSIKSLIWLFQNGYNLRSIKNIIQNNIKPKKIYLKNTKLYSNNNIIYHMPVSLLKKAYFKCPLYLRNKQNIYIKGINLLISKKCKIIYIELPYHQITKKIEDKSPIKKHTQKFKIELAKKYKIKPFDTLIISNKQNAMYDLTHLNQYGANIVSKKVSNLINLNKWNSFLIVELD